MALCKIFILKGRTVASFDRFLSAPQLPPIAPASPFVMRQQQSEQDWKA
jgi:hypothetical protein